MTAMSAVPDVEETKWTIARLLTWTSEYLAKREVDDPRLSAEVLLAHATQCRRIDLYARFDRVPDEDRVERFRGLVRRAAEQEPIAYLVGEKEFFSLALIVTRDVLIPRAETETLVECVVDHCRTQGLSAPRLLDLGTGSGCLVVAALVQLDGATALAADICPKALSIAHRNAERHGVLDRVTLVEADGLSLPEDAAPSGFDVLMCNPPYIPATAIAQLDACVRDYEPMSALSDGGDGLSFYRAIADDGARFLAAGGVVMVEVGDGMATGAADVLASTGTLRQRDRRKDRVTGNERVLVFEVASTG